MTCRRTLLAGFVLALAVLLSLGVPQVSQAWWSTSVRASATVGSGTVRLSISGFSDLNATLSPMAASVTASVTVRNTGTLPITSITASSSASGAVGSVLVTVWPAASGTCATPPSNASSGTWSQLTWPAVTTPIAPGASADYCVRAAIAAAVSGSVIASVTVSAADASWAGSPVTASLAQSVATTVAASDGAAIIPASNTAVRSASYSLYPTPDGYQFCLAVVVSGAGNGASNWSFKVDTTKSPYDTVLVSSWTAQQDYVDLSQSNGFLDVGGRSGHQTLKQDDQLLVTLCAAPAS